MKIVKEFDYPEFAADMGFNAKDSIQCCLGSNGVIYWRITWGYDGRIDFGHEHYLGGWKKPMTLKHLCRIVKEFGHLRAFL
jgi:hypothetical protein